MRRGRKNWVRIKADFETRKDLPGIRLQVTDSGQGFAEETLKSISNEPAQSDTIQKRGNGIRNVVSRLNLIYKGKAAITFSNAEGNGAIIDMWLPIDN